MKTKAWSAILIVLLVVPAAYPVGAQEAPTDLPRVSMGVGTDIDRQTRTLVGAADTFTVAADDTLLLWCYTLLENLDVPTHVTHAWFHEGRTEAMVALDVTASWYRTWSNKRILSTQTGPWEVKVLDADGTVLGASSFEVR